MLRDRFSRPLDRAAAAFSASVREDERLLPHDLWGSIVHAEMLGQTEIVRRSESDRLVEGLRALARRAAAGRFPLDPALEDVHMNVEAALRRRLGATADRLPTGRSRNDQVATDLLLYLRDALLALELRTVRVGRSLLGAAAGPDGRGLVEGWTHLQPAQRVYWSHWLSSHGIRFARDAERLAATRQRLTESPLGSGALAGSSLPLDRHRTARSLGFERPSASSIDGVSDRDAVAETLFDLALLTSHLSSLAEELVIGSMPGVGRVRLSDGFVTTSSLMPHKRNPDLAELVRSEAGPSIGRLVAHLGVLKGLPLGYQRDLQTGKPILFEGVERALLLLEVVEGMVREARFLPARSKHPEATASVELADALVGAGVPFRVAHARVARWAAAGITERAVAPDELRRAFPEIVGSGFEWPTPEEEPERRRTVGGSSRSEVAKLQKEVLRRLARSEREARRERERLRRLRERAGAYEPDFLAGAVVRRRSALPRSAAGRGRSGRSSRGAGRGARPAGARSARGR